MRKKYHDCLLPITTDSFFPTDFSHMQQHMNYWLAIILVRTVMQVLFMNTIMIICLMFIGILNTALCEAVEWKV